MKKLLISVALIFLSLNINAAISQSGITDLKQLNGKQITELISGNTLTGYISDGQFQGDIVAIYERDIVAKYEKKGSFAILYVPEDKLYYGSWKVRQLDRAEGNCTKGFNVPSYTCYYWFTGIKDGVKYAYVKRNGQIIFQFHKVRTSENQKVKISSNKKKKVTDAQKKRNAEIVESMQKEAEEAGYSSYSEMQAEEKRIADAKKAESLKNQKELKKKAAERKRVADAKKEDELKKQKRTAEIELNKKISLLTKSELQEAQNFLNHIQLFVKKNNTEFDIFEITEFIINTKNILDGSFTNKDKKNIEEFKKFTNESLNFQGFRRSRLLLEQRKEIQGIEKIMQTLDFNITTLQNNYDNVVFRSDISKLSKASKRTLDNPKTKLELENAVKSTRFLIDKMTMQRNQVQTANSQIALLTKYLSENMTSNDAPQVMSNLRKIKNAINQETQIAILSNGESLRAYLDAVISEANLFITANIPLNKIETKPAVNKAEVATYPVNNSPYSKVNNDVGCGSTYSKEKRKDIFDAKYKNHWMKWSGEILIVSSDKVSLNVDNFGTQDLSVFFAKKGAGYNLREGQKITVKFLMKSTGGCYLPFGGTNATRVSY